MTMLILSGYVLLYHKTMTYYIVVYLSAACLCLTMLEHSTIINLTPQGYLSEGELDPNYPH